MELTLNDYFYSIYVPTNSHLWSERTLNNVCMFYGRYVLKTKLGVTEITAVNVRTINEWVVTSILSNKSLLSSSKLKYFKLLSAVFQQAVNLEYIQNNPCVKAKHIFNFTNTDSSVIRAFTVEEMELIIKNAPKFGRITELFVLLSFFTGARLNEILHIRYSDMNQQNATITINGTKTSSSKRQVTVPYWVLNRVYELQDTRNDYVFAHPNGKLRMADTMRKRFYTLLKALNIPHRRIHDIRHTYATYLITVAKCDVYTVSKFLGHKNPTITLQRYTHLTQQSKESVRLAMSTLTV